MSKIQEWNYAGEADITFGEVHISPAPKIALAITILVVIAATIAGIVFRDVLGDMIVNPQLVLNDSITDEEGFINVEVYSNFDPNVYITDANVGKYELTNIENNVDTSKLGEYNVIYTSKNSVNTESQELKIRVIDRTEPVILLKTNDSNLPIELDNGQYITTVLVNSDIANSFDPEQYIDIIVDNYSASDKITHEVTNKLDFSKVGLVTVVYSAIDENGNKGKTTLNISVVEEFDAERQEYEDKIAEMEEELAKLKEQQNNNNNDKPGNNNKPDNHTPNDNNQPTTEEQTPPAPKNSLSADSCTISMSAVGGTWQGVVVKASSYVHYSGTGNAHASSGVGITEFPNGPGTYSITWVGDNGLSCTQTITVTE